MFHQADNSLGGDSYNIFIYEPTIFWHPHFHRNIEAVLCLEGNCRLTVDGRTEILSAGDYALILPEQIHAYETPERARVWVGVFSPDYFGVLHHLLRHGRPDGFVFHPEQAADRLIRSFLLAKDPSPLQLSAVLTLAADCFLSALPSLPRHKNDPAERIRAYVEEHYSTPLTLRETADALGYEYHYLSRLFRKTMGMSFAEYLSLFRHRRALELLEDGELSITEIASESGYGSLRSFHLHFARLQGCTPREYQAGLPPKKDF